MSKCGPNCHQYHAETMQEHVDDDEALRDEIAELREELEELRKDAQRYLYLRNRSPSDVLYNSGPANGCWIDMDGDKEDDGTMPLVLLTGDDADKMIDKAMSASRKT